MHFLSKAVTARSLAFALMLAGCAGDAERPAYPELTWTHLRPFTLDVVQIEIVSEYIPANTPPQVDHLFPLSPAKAAQGWARGRLRAGGTSNLARFIVRDGSVIETALPRTTGVTGVVTKDQAYRYDAKLSVTLEIRDMTGRVLGQVATTVTKSRTVAENIDRDERDKIWFAMSEELAKAMDTELERAIPLHLGRWLQR
jgi:hypothetical protein